MQYNFDAWVPRVHYQSAKWSQLTEENPTAEGVRISLGIAEMDFPCSEAISQAICARAKQGILGYTFGFHSVYMDAICSWQKRMFNLNVTPDQVVYCRGANPALSALVQCLTKPGEGVIVQPPVFQYFFNAVKQNERVLVENMLAQDESGAYSIDFADLEAKAADPNTTLLILCNPNNPTGNLWSEQDLRRLGDICLKNGVRIVSDDVHQEIVRRGLTFTSLASLFPESKDIITVTSLSKGFNMAGLQLCHVILPGEEERNAFLDTIKRQGPTPLELAATVAAYTESDDWLEQVNAYIDGNIRFFDAFMARELPQVRYVSPQATYMMWLDMSCMGLDAEELNTLLKEKALLGLNTGGMYGGNGDTYIRFNLATPRFVLEEALKRLAQLVQA